MRYPKMFSNILCLAKVCCAAQSRDYKVKYGDLKYTDCSLVPRPPLPAFVACSTKSGGRPGRTYHMIGSFRHTTLLVRVNKVVCEANFRTVVSIGSKVHRVLVVAKVVKQNKVPASCYEALHFSWSVLRVHDTGLGTTSVVTTFWTLIHH